MSPFHQAVVLLAIDILLEEARQLLIEDAMQMLARSTFGMLHLLFTSYVLMHIFHVEL
jgi:ABC-type iron transport system FetAB permease component